jgi:hypothetical protein
MRSVRLVALAFAALGGGLAWMEALQAHAVMANFGSADSDQPEALLFTSLYAFPLMGMGTLLIAASLCLLMLARRNGQMRFAVAAGACVLLLGNIHTYDIFQVAAAWGAYLIADAVAKRRVDSRVLAQGLVAGLIGAPSVVYEVWALARETVFRERANVPTLPGDPSEYVLGYGVLGVLAIVAVAAWVRRRPGAPTARVADAGWLRLMACWAATSLLLVYVVKVPFERKLIMGEGIPLAFLASCGAHAAAEWLTRFWPRMVTYAVLCLIALPSSFVFGARDLARADWAKHGHLDSVQSPYVEDEELDAFGWLRAHSPHAESAVMPAGLALVYPGFADRPVWSAHYGETPDYKVKRGEFEAAIDVRTSPASRLASLRSTGATWFVYPVDPSATSLHEFPGPPNTPAAIGPGVAGLPLAYSNGQVEVFRIMADARPAP